MMEVSFVASLHAAPLSFPPPPSAVMLSVVFVLRRCWWVGGCVIGEVDGVAAVCLPVMAWPLFAVRCSLASACRPFACSRCA